MKNKIIRFMNCCFKDCKYEAYCHRKNRFGMWFRLCKKHLREVKMISD